MIFSFSITTPANTAETAKLPTVLKIGYGIIHQIDIQFPMGPSGLLHLHINNALNQVWPYNTGEDFALDATTVRFREFIKSLEEPFQLTAYTWNEDDTYEHTVFIRIGILPPAVVAPWLMSYAERLALMITGE